MKDDKYPNSFLRGIPNDTFIHEGLVLQSAFQFDENNRLDNMSEASINWLDDKDAISIALSQRKSNGQLQFAAGVAKIDLDVLKLVLRSIPTETFSYERSPLPENKYHGNLLMISSAKKPIKQLIMNGLALAAGTNIIPQVVPE